MPITVENNHTYRGAGTYIGRTRDPEMGIFGNPFSHMDGTLAKYKVATREEAIEKYREWVITRLDESEYFRLALTTLVKRYRSGENIVFVCWCKPAPCHGDILKELIEQMAELGIDPDRQEDNDPF